MVSELVVEGAALLIGGLAFGALVFSYAYGYHILRRIDQSATETALTETLRVRNNVPAVK